MYIHKFLRILFVSIELKREHISQLYDSVIKTSSLCVLSRDSLSRLYYNTVNN